jgi:hypothetical protein
MPRGWSAASRSLLVALSMVLAVIGCLLPGASAAASAYSYDGPQQLSPQAQTLPAGHGPQETSVWGQSRRAVGPQFALAASGVAAEAGRLAAKAGRLAAKAGRLAASRARALNLADDTGAIKVGRTAAEPIDTSGAQSTNFIVHPNGDVVPVPEGAAGPTPVDSGKGFQFTGGSGGHGLDPATSDVRIMDSVTSGKYQYPNGYASYSNSAGQAVNPYSGETVGRSDPLWHWAF